MEKHIITIEITSNIDPSTLLSLAITCAEQLAQEIEDHGNDVTFDDNDVVVESDIVDDWHWFGVGLAFWGVSRLRLGYGIYLCNNSNCLV